MCSSDLLAPLVTQELFRTLGDLNRTDGISMLIVEQNAGLALGVDQQDAERHRNR